MNNLIEQLTNVEPYPIKNAEANLNLILGYDVNKKIRWFNHGAEMQNLEFLQPVDEKVRLFVPGGCQDVASGVISRGNLPQVLAKLACCGYAVHLNPLYAWAVPPQSGHVHEMTPADGHDVSETFGHLSADNFKDQTEKTTKALWLDFKKALSQQQKTCEYPQFAQCLSDTHKMYYLLYQEAATESMHHAGAFSEYLQNLIDGRAHTFPSSCSDLDLK